MKKSVDVKSIFNNKDNLRIFFTFGIIFLIIIGLILGIYAAYNRVNESNVVNDKEGWLHSIYDWNPIKWLMQIFGAKVYTNLANSHCINVVGKGYGYGDECYREYVSGLNKDGTPKITYNPIKKCGPCLTCTSVFDISTKIYSNENPDKNRPWMINDPIRISKCLWADGPLPYKDIDKCDDYCYNGIDIPRLGGLPDGPLLFIARCYKRYPNDQNSKELQCKKSCSKHEDCEPCEYCDKIYTTSGICKNYQDGVVDGVIHNGMTGPGCTGPEVEDINGNPGPYLNGVKDTAGNKDFVPMLNPDGSMKGYRCIGGKCFGEQRKGDKGACSTTGLEGNFFGGSSCKTCYKCIFDQGSIVPQVQRYCRPIKDQAHPGFCDKGYKCDQNAICVYSP